MSGNGTTDGGAAADASLRTAHERLLQHNDIQFNFPRFEEPPRPQPPDWLRNLLDFLGHIFQWLQPFFQFVFYAGAGLLVLVIVYLVAQSLMGASFPFRRKPKPAAPAEPEWRPDEQTARVLLEDADRLAGEGRYAEAAHLLLHRSLDDVKSYRPQALRPAVTSRELAVSEALPPTARNAFSHIAQVVETSYFGTGGVDRDAYAECRRSYEAFAFPQVWTA